MTNIIFIISTISLLLNIYLVNENMNKDKLLTTARNAESLCVAQKEITQIGIDMCNEEINKQNENFDALTYEYKINMEHYKNMNPKKVYETVYKKIYIENNNTEKSNECKDIKDTLDAVRGIELPFVQ